MTEDGRPETVQLKANFHPPSPVLRLPSQTNMTCKIEFLTLAHNVRVVRLSNQFVSIDVLPDKGADIYALVHKASGVDVMWKSPTGLRGPNEGRYSPDSQVAWLEQYEGGWQEIAPNGGNAGDYKGVELSFHGESTLLPWSYEVIEESPNEIIVDFHVTMFRSPFRITRRMSLRADSAAIRFDERLTNLANEAMELMWGHHPAYGEPFLSGDCRIQTNATKVVSAVSDNTGLQGDVVSAWPNFPTTAGGQRDLSVVPPKDDGTSTMVYLTDFDGPPWYAVLNPKLGVAVGMAWSPDVFKYLWLWQEMGGASGFPWYKRVYTMALEPWSSYTHLGAGLVTVMETTKNQLKLKPREVIAASLTVTLFEVDANTQVREIGLDGLVTVSS